MGRTGRRRLRTLAAAFAQAHPHITRANALIAAGRVLVDGIAVRNPSTLVRPGASIVIRRDARLRGEAKLEAALAAGADLVALVKPQFELGLAEPPDDPDRLREAQRRAAAGFAAAGWIVRETIESPVRGARGAVEFLLHGSRR